MNTYNTTPSPLVLRKLASVATAVKFDGDFWVITSRRRESDSEIFFDHKSASDRLSVLQERESSFDLYGPYRNEPDSDLSPEKEDMVAVLTVIRESDGSVNLVNWNPTKFDALFWTQSAMEKFLIPYYSNLYGPAYAEELRREMAGENCVARGHGVRSRSYPCSCYALNSEQASQLLSEWADVFSKQIAEIADANSTEICLSFA